jgi:oxalate decarboxylase/phosphoglucose isomerase-like protein (cupin superfamily)
VIRVVSKYKALHHYTWGAACDGWNLTDSETLHVKHERMPPGATEATHYHKSAQQFFFILIGTATFEIETVQFVYKLAKAFISKPANGTWFETIVMILWNLFYVRSHQRQATA